MLFTSYCRIFAETMETYTIMKQLDAQRQAQNVKIREICAFADITPRFYSSVIAGKSDISLGIVLKLAQKLGFSVFLGVKNENFEGSTEQIRKETRGTTSDGSEYNTI